MSRNERHIVPNPSGGWDIKRPGERDEGSRDEMWNSDRLYSGGQRSSGALPHELKLESIEAPHRRRRSSLPRRTPRPGSIGMMSPADDGPSGDRTSQRRSRVTRGHPRPR